MEHVFWLEPGKLAGRPGPNRVPWTPEALRELGIAAVLTVNDGEGCDFARIAAAGLEHCLVPLPPNEPPQPGDEELCRSSLPSAYDFVKLSTREIGPCSCTVRRARTGPACS